MKDHVSRADARPVVAATTAASASTATTPSTATIDLNADMGESFGAWRMADDTALLDVVTSANIACGFHAGDPTTMVETVTAAAQRSVAIGAHVAYPDLAGFGRRFIDMDPRDLEAAVLYQFSALDGICRALGTRVSYVKPHGALYNRIIDDEKQAGAVVAAVASYGRNNGPLPILSQPGSLVHQLAADRKIPTLTEAFPDRAYRADGMLLPRSEPGAVIDDPAVVAARAVQFATRGTVTTVSGDDIAVAARSLCVHGDTPGAVAIAATVRDALVAAGVGVASAC